MGRRILSDAGYEVVTVNNGSAALKKIAENKPDLIVLDVYMPGYGGLEVCQRIKESHETRQIPVLLTVGKLEPFKQEEARRVGADAFIIKPFEATELLTVLTRLEDKIVAQPQPQKTGRFAKALAAIEQSDGDRFGDKETGWKNRLTIPRPGMKPKAEEDAPEAVVGSSSAAESRVPEASEPQSSDLAKPAEPSRDFERPIPAGLPADITPEEIAAITAAAAAFGGQPETAATSPEAVASTDAVATQEAAPAEVASSPAEIAAPAQNIPTVDAEVPSPTLPPAPETAQDIPVAASPEAQSAVAEVPSDAVAASDSASVEVTAQSAEAPAASEAPAVEAVAQALASETQISQSEKPASGDAEVMAAIDSLSPSSGALESVPPVASGSNGAGHDAAASGHAFSDISGVKITGPRWIAEAVAVAAEESKLALDQEMEQAHAARAVAQSAELATATAADVPSSPAAVATAEPEISAIAGSVESVAAAAESVPAAIAAEASVVETSIADTAATQSASIESPAPDSSTAAPAIVEEVAPEAAASAIASSAVASSTIEASTTDAVSVPQEAAFAAAAAAGSATDYSSPVETASAATAVPEPAASKPAEVEPQREAELAAAWRNWKQIRESLAESQAASPAVKTPASEDKSSPAEEEVAPAPSAPASAAPAEIEVAAAEAPEESTAIASIVDSMLAELRPKLVEEIAKKMSSEKKDKDREKEKEKKKKR
jgi:CheY-like chemotaxis protein